MAAGATPVVNPSRFSRPVVIGIGASGGVALLTALLEVAGPKAIPLVESMIHWGPLFVIVVLGMELLHSTINTWGKQFVNAAITNATALQSMADAMQRISQKEDERDRERELVLDHLAYTTQQILKGVESIQADGCSKAGLCNPKLGGNSNG